METERYYSNRPLLDLFEFEAVLDAPVDAVPAGDELSPDAAPDATLGAPGEGDPPSSPATAEAPAWTPDDPAFRDAIRQEAEALVRAQLGALEQAVVGEPETPTFNLDPFSETFAQDFQAMIRQELSAIAGPLQARQMAEQEAEGELRIKDMIADDINRNGDLSEPGKAQVRSLVNVYYTDFVETYGPTARTVELATQKATAAVRAIESEAAKSAVERYKNELGTLAGAPNGDLPAGPRGGAVGANGLTPAMTIDEVVQRNARIMQGNRVN